MAVTDPQKKNETPDIFTELADGVTEFVTTRPLAVVWLAAFVWLADPLNAGDWLGAFWKLGTLLVLLLILSHVIPPLGWLLPTGPVNGKRIRRYDLPKARVKGQFTSSREKRGAKKIAAKWGEVAEVSGLGRALSPDRVEVPVMASIEGSPLGLTALVRPLPGQTLDELMAARDRLASSWGCEVRAKPSTAVHGVVYDLILRDALAGTRSAEVKPVSLGESSEWQA